MTKVGHTCNFSFIGVVLLSIVRAFSFHTLAYDSTAFESWRQVLLVCRYGITYRSHKSVGTSEKRI